ncbi:MAG: hypothetical protein GTO40_12350 [Deltaproteobacteria bacterium]|nr:hypothetical protein [Deltaproteobacteria bacterium]
MAGMTLSLAEQCIGKIKTKAQEAGVEVSIAVVDEAGSLVAYARTGDKRVGFGEKVAIAKAKTAVAFKRNTQSIRDQFAGHPGNYNIIGLSAMYPGEFWVGPGGIPLLIKGELIGGVGVAGPSPEDLQTWVAMALEGIDELG